MDIFLLHKYTFKWILLTRKHLLKIQTILKLTFYLDLNSYRMNNKNDYFLLIIIINQGVMDKCNQDYIFIKMNKLHCIFVKNKSEKVFLY